MWHAGFLYVLIACGSRWKYRLTPTHYFVEAISYYIWLCFLIEDIQLIVNSILLHIATQVIGSPKLTIWKHKSLTVLWLHLVHFATITLIVGLVHGWIVSHQLHLVANQSLWNKR